ncbi:MAG: MATE family efflux transporter [Eubacteriales bacterium]
MTEKKTGIIRDFTTGSIGRELLLFSVPFMLSNALQVLYSMVDMAVVGNVVGSAGLSAVSTASQVVNFMTMLCVGFATGGQVYISQLIGAGRRDALRAAIGTLFSLVALIGAGMTVLGTVFARVFLRWLSTPAESFDMAVAYLLVCAGGMLFTYGYNVVSAVLRGMGNSKMPFVFIAVASVVNLVLDCVFVIWLRWGVTGAAVATVIGQAVSFVYSVIYLARRHEAFGFDFRPASFRMDKTALRTHLRLGIPFALRSGAVNLSMMFVTGLVNGEGVVASAVFGVGLKVDDIVNKISVGITYAVSTMVGQNIAAGKIDRVKKSVYWGWAYALILYAVFTLVYLTEAEALFGLFTQDAAVRALAPVFVSALVWSFPAMILMRGTNGFTQGIGNSGLSLAFSLLDGVILRIGLSWLLGVACGLGIFGFFLGYGLATYGTAIPGMIYFFSGIWKKRRMPELARAAGDGPESRG